MHYDIIIIGAGPAGATLARLLDSKFKIAIIDRKSEKISSFKKPCGGLLAPDAQKSIGSFGMSVPLDIMVSPQIFAVETIDIDQHLKRYYQRFYLNMDRHKLDLWLMSLIPDNVDRYFDSFCSSVTKNEDGFSVEFIKDGKTSKITSRYIVGADGAHSVVRKFIGGGHIRQYLSIQKNYKAEHQRPYYVCFFDNTITDCYGWINVKNDVIQLGGAFYKKTAKQDFNKLENYFKAQGYPLNEIIEEEACLVNSPKTLKELCLGKGNALLVGESAGFISTSSLEGMSFAMDSALELAKSFNKCGKNVYRQYKKNTRKIYFKVFTKQIKASILYNPFLRKLIMKSGISSIDCYDESNKKTGSPLL